ncbi:MAG: T9SS type A sorting domain-containing protein [Ignavibacteria bacterium]
MGKNSYKSILLITFFFLSLTSFKTALSYPTGIVGRTFKNGGLGCSCHGNLTSSVNVFIIGADSLAVGQTKAIRIKIQGGAAIAGGFNVAAKLGTLSVGAFPGIQLISEELTHTTPKLFSADTVSWFFNYTAPSTPGYDTLYACGNSTNNNGQSTGDTWNFLIRMPVKIYQPVGIRNQNEIATSFLLNQNYPNPFNAITNIKFSLPKENKVKLTIYDLNGKEIATLINSNYAAGTYSYQFDASALSSGVYFYRLDAEGYSAIRKMTLLK